MKGKQIWVLLLCSLLLVSCIQVEQMEQIGIIDARGVDLLDNGLLETTLVIYQFSDESAPITKTRTGKGHTLKGALQDTEQSTSYKLTPGKIKIEIFGKAALESGILPYLDTMTRDARMADLMYMIASDTTAKEILTIEESTISKDVGQYIFDLIENSSHDHNIPRKTVQDFLRIYYDIGQDNVLPIFNLKEGIPNLRAIAVLQGDRYVGEITNSEAELINLMNLNVKNHPLQLSVPIEPFKDHLEKRESPQRGKRIYLSLEINDAGNKTRIVDKENLTFQTDINIVLHLLEQSAGLIVKNKHVLKQLEKEVEKELTTQFEELLTKLQRFNADPFGYGRYYRLSKKDGKITRDEWKEKFPNIDVEFKVNAKLTNYGITE